MTAERQDAGVLLRLQGEMNIYRAAELKQELLAPIARDASVEIDLSGVTDLDTAGLQVLMLAKKTAQSAGCELRLVAHSPVVVDVLELLHLSSWFGDPLVIPPSSSSSAR